MENLIRLCVGTKILEMIKKLSIRHGLPFYKAIPYELFIRTYKMPMLRMALKKLFPEKHPREIFFVIGVYNSGTTIIKNSISAHPDIAAAPIEGDLLTHALSSQENGCWPRGMLGNCFKVMEERRTGRISAEQFISDLRPWIKNEKYFLEKSISNTLRIPLLRHAFSRPRFVCVVRNPVDVVRGIGKRSRPCGFASKILMSSRYPVVFLLRQWVFFYKLVILDYLENKHDIYLCSYEKFIDHPVEEISKIYQFLGLGSIDCSFRNGDLVLSGKSIPIRPRSKPSHKDYCDTVNKINEVIVSMEKELGC